MASDDLDVSLTLNGLGLIFAHAYQYGVFRVSIPDLQSSATVAMETSIQQSTELN